MGKKGFPAQGQDAEKGVKKREIAGILLLAFSVFAIISLYVDTVGYVGLQIRGLLRILFGDASVVFVAVLFFASLCIFRGRRRPFSKRKSLGLILLLLAASAIFHMLYYRGYQFPPKLMEEIGYAKKGEGAGVLGAVLLVFSYNAFGIPGSYIFVGAAILIGIIFFFEISLIALSKKVLSKVTQAVLTLLHNFKDTLRSWWEALQIRRFKKKQRTALEPAASGEDEGLSGQAGAVKVKKEPQQKKEQIVKADSKGEDGGQLLLEFEKDADRKEYSLPPVYLLKKGGARIRKTEGLQKELLEKTFNSFGIDAKVVNVAQGPVVTRYELQPAPGIKVSRITVLADDLALALAAEDVRIEAPVPGKAVVGIEVPNKSVEPVLLRDVLESPEFTEQSSPIALALGKNIAGKAVVADLTKWLHVLVAGATGSGKSVCLNAMIASVLFKAGPDEVKFLMIDPKRVELSAYDGIPHLISPVVTDPRKAAVALRWAVTEMERRYKIFAEAGVRNIEAYSTWEGDGQTEKEPLPLMVIIVDELADLMMVAAAEVEDAVCRLAQMARAAGIYLIIATQRPSVDVITGLIKANVPSRISFAVSSQVDSRTILDMGGAERLIGKGDMLYYPVGASKPMRAQGAWISDQEVETLVSFWKKQGEPEYVETVQDESPELTGAEEEDDELLEDAIRLVIENGQASISMLQRRFRIGYSRAARLVDVMEVRGIVGSHQGSKPREVLVDSTFLKER
ncbi:MAG: DNA translocase FtsK [Firmicutes bacterium]|nr:DNA translocase FtsK [Bacillota bacterium]